MRNVIFTSKATAKNGRGGHVTSDDGLIDLDLVNPAEDKQGKGSNPEQLFAAAYSGCFDSSLHLVASQKNKKIDSQTTAEVSFLKDPADEGFKIAATLNIQIAGVNPEEAEELAQGAHQVCPYSKATRGNIDVTLNPKAVEEPS
ncbi:organic hydroperoxide resistance protein [Lentibacillus salinarum]|uniref:Organic hydroperoxide resistance protein n=1 Tax=Lentibacillus salinarum TaxID=446820 RepID=A0ABW3ZQ79_9BACI